MNIREQYLKRADAFIKEDEEVFTEERIQNIVESAQNAFWAKIAELVPEASNGNIDLSTKIRFDEAAKKAATAWINYNATDNPVM